jgi:hypothetical protein
MKFERKIILFLRSLADTALATALLILWVICCTTVALLLRIAGVSDLPSDDVIHENNGQNQGSYLSRYCRKQLLKSKTFLTKIPERLGI